MKPFLHWTGNRTHLATAIRMRFPIQYSCYYEPMLGGGSVFLNLQRKNESVILGDRNSWLIDCYQALRDEFHQVADVLESLTPCVQVYNEIRKIHPSHVSQPYRAAHLIYLNQLAFGHVFRINREGYFNVPFGEVRSLFYDRDELRDISSKLRYVTLLVQDYEETVLSAKEGDFVYFDPPPSETVTFGSSGNKNGSYDFQEKDYRRLHQVCQDLDRRRVKWALSDNNTSLVRFLFGSYNTVPLLLDPRDHEIKHLLITNYDSLTGELIPSHQAPRKTLDAAKPSCRTPCTVAPSGCGDPPA